MGRRQSQNNDEIETVNNKFPMIPPQVNGATVNRND